MCKRTPSADLTVALVQWVEPFANRSLYQLEWHVQNRQLLELTLDNRPQDQALASRLYGELRTAILEARLSACARLPASRDFARLHRLSRGTEVRAFSNGCNPRGTLWGG